MSQTHLRSPMRASATASLIGLALVALAGTAGAAPRPVTNLAAPAPLAPAPLAPVNATATTPATATNPDLLPDIRDIRPPLHLPGSWPWMLFVFGAAGVVAAGIVVWRRIRSPEQLKSLSELTLQRLENTRPLMEAGDVRGFSAAVSEIIRSYIEQKFNARALRRTTTEFLRDCIALPDSPLRQYEQALDDFLTHCDLAKFARWVLSQAEMEAMLASAGTIVRETTSSTEAVKAVPVPGDGDEEILAVHAN